ncbi:MAG: hypothetical protein ABWZ25_10855 [Chitinophagaceae bacterium]
MRQVLKIAGPLLIISGLLGCMDRTKTSTPDKIPVLKRGELISCGRMEEGFGTISFDLTIPDSLRNAFNTAVALLHSFEYDEAEKQFARIIDVHPDCAMAYWGVAMSNFHPLWTPPDKSEIEKGQQMVGIARSIKNKTARESAYIEAIARFYDSAQSLPHRTRVLRFETAMAGLHQEYPGDLDATVFYALALNAAADQTDKTLSKQQKAITILMPIFEKQPLHPGVAHLIIHNCDDPNLAARALPAARKYASIAPASAHAQHMPSHIFIRLGLWEESISSNRAAASSAICYAEQAGINGHWDEELHALDYLMYAYLQQGDDSSAKRLVEYVQGMDLVSPFNFKVAYAFAAIPARYYLERKQWHEAAELKMDPPTGSLKDFPWQQAIVHFTRLLGQVHTGKISAAKNELVKLQDLHQFLVSQKEKEMETRQVSVLMQTAKAWLTFYQGNRADAIKLMANAAELEDGMAKHPVSPGEILPAREMFADMLLQAGQPIEALNEYKQVLQSHALRFNALHGALIAAYKSGDKQSAREFYNSLQSILKTGSPRKELREARQLMDLAAQSASAQSGAKKSLTAL